MAWYDDFEYQVPKDVLDINTMLSNRDELTKRREGMFQRLIKGRQFLEKENITHDEMKKANELLIFITNEIIEVDMAIVDIYNKLRLILESESIGDSIRVKVPGGENSLGDKVEESIINFEKINVNDLCMLKAVKDIFGISPNNIEFKSE